MDLNRRTMKKLMGLIAFAILLYVGLQNTKLAAGALRYLLGLLAPFIIGGCFAFVLNVPMRFFEKQLFSSAQIASPKHLSRVRRVVSLVLTLSVVLGVIAVVSFMVVPELYNSIAAIGRELAQASARAPQMFDDLAAKLPMFENELMQLKDSFLNVDWQSLVTIVVGFLWNGNLLSSTVNIATSVANGVANTVIGLVFAVYILLQKETLGRQFRRLFYSFLPEKQVDRFLRTCSLTSVSFNRFLSGQCLEAFILGMMFFISMSIFKMPYALVIAALIGVTALIPIFGAFIGCFVGALLILIASPMQALWFVVLFLVLQQIEGNIIYPRVVGSSVGLPSIWVLAAVTLGASIAGVIGILVAIPVCSVIYTLLRESVRTRIRERGIAEEKIG